MKILITGGAGFIGSQLSLELARRRHQITILDNLSQNKDSQLLAELKRHPQIIFHRADVRDPKIVRRLVPCAEAIIHLAAETGTGQSMYEIAQHTDVNVGGTANLLQALVDTKNQVRKFILASSRAVYGEGINACPKHGSLNPASRSIQDMEAGDFELKCPHCRRPLRPRSTPETTSPAPASIYAITKNTQEQLVQTTCHALGLPHVILRFQNVYGPHQSLTNPYTGLISIFANQLLANQPVNIFEDGRESRDFVFIKDAIQAIKLALASKFEDGRVYNIGSGQGTSVKKLAEMLKIKLKSKSTLQFTGQFRLGDIRHNRAELSRARKELGFRPNYDLEKGLNAYIRWLKKSPVGPLDYLGSLREMQARKMLKKSNRNS